MTDASDAMILYLRSLANFSDDDISRIKNKTNPYNGRGVLRVPLKSLDMSPKTL